MIMETIIKNSLMTQVALFMAAIINAIPQSYYNEYMSFFPNIKAIINTENCYVIYKYRNDNILGFCSSSNQV